MPVIPQLSTIWLAFSLGITHHSLHGEWPSFNDLCVPRACIRTVSGPHKSCHHPRTALTQRFYMQADPVEDAREAKFSPIQFLSIDGGVNEFVPGLGIDFDVETIASQEDVSGGEGDPFVAVEEAVIVA